jgi:Uri superfamily endonuclease
VYVGSAQANLKQRVKRHLRKEKHLFWHIDFLLESEAAQIEKVLYIQGDKATECEIAKEISTRGDPVNRFGCSDCKCQSHLFHVVDVNFLEKQMRALELAT